MEMQYDKKDLTKSPEVKAAVLPDGWSMHEVRGNIWLYDPKGTRTKHGNKKDAIAFASK